MSGKSWLLIALCMLSLIATSCAPMTPPPVTSDYIARTNFSTLSLFDEYFNGTDNVSGVATINYDLENSILTIFANGSTNDNNTLAVDGDVVAEDFCTSGSCLSTLQASYIEGSILFSNGTVITEDNDNLYWDDANDRLGVQTTNPETTLDVRGDDGIRAGGIDVDFVGTPESLSGTLVSGTGLEVGTYIYMITYNTSVGETSARRIAGNEITTTPGNQSVKLTLPTIDDIRVDEVLIYRSEVGGNVYGLRFLDAVPIGTTEYTDDIPDASLQPASGIFYQADTTSRGITFNNETALNVGGFTFVGNRAGDELSRNNNNEVLVGNLAGYSADSSYGLTAIGAAAGYNSYGQFSTYLGMSSGVSDTGSRNVIMGYYAGYGTQGNSNTLIGHQAGYQNRNSYVVGVGRGSAYQNSGSDSTFIGVYSGDGNSGDRVTGLGRSALTDNTGDDVVAIGFNAGNSNIANDQFIVQQANVNSVPLIQGDFDTGHLGVGTVTAQNRLDVEGGVAVGSSYSGSTTAPTNGMVVEGDVGVGTSSPGTALPADFSSGRVLDISNSSSNAGVIIRGGAPDRGMDLWSRYGNADVHIDSRFDNGGTSVGEIIFRTRTAGTPVTAMRIYQDGNIGMGTAPSHKLDVESDDQVVSRFKSTSSSSFVIIGNSPNQASIGFDSSVGAVLQNPNIGGSGVGLGVANAGDIVPYPLSGADVPNIGRDTYPFNSLFLKGNASADYFIGDGSLLTNISGATIDSINSTQVEMNELFELYDWYNTVQSAGRVSGGKITDNGDGTVRITNGQGLIKSMPSSPSDGEECELGSCASISENLFVNWSEVPSLALVDNAYNYIYYDGSSASIETTTNFYNVDYTQDFTIGRAYAYDGEITVRLCGTNLWNFNRRVQLFGEERFPVERAQGMMIAESGNRGLSLTSGVLWAELINRFTTDSFDSATSSDNFTYWHLNGTGGFTRVFNQSVIDNAQYDDGTGTLATLTPNRYGVHWVYQVHDSTVHVVYGRGDYKLQEAQESTTPNNIPGLLSSYAILVGKVIVAEGDTNLYSVESPFVQTFQVSGVTDHGELAGLADNDHPQYVSDTGDTMSGDLNVDANITTSNLTVSESATVAKLIICDNGTSTIMTRNRSLAISKGCDV